MRYGRVEVSGIKGVARSQNSAANGDLRSRTPARIAVAVPPLVVVADEVLSRAEMAQRGKDLDADTHVLSDVRHFVGGQGSRLVEDRLAHADRANVVKAPGEAQLLDGLGVKAEVLTDCGSHGGDALGVAAQVGILGLERVDERLGNAHRERSQSVPLRFELGGALRDFLANDSFDTPLVHQQAALVQSSLHGGFDLGHPHRLDEIVHDAEIHRVHGRARVVGAGDHDHRHLRVDLAEATHCFEAVHAGHPHVAER